MRGALSRGALSREVTQSFQRLHRFPKTPAPLIIPQLCSATHPSPRGTHLLDGFASKSRNCTISRESLEPKCLHYQPKHLEWHYAKLKALQKEVLFSSFLFPSGNKSRLCFSCPGSLVSSERETERASWITTSNSQPRTSKPGSFVPAKATIANDAKTSSWGTGSLRWF